jgi:hypothetical protein
MVKFMISEIMIVIAQESRLNGNISHNNTTPLNSTNSVGKNIVVTWLESNKTHANSAPMISVSHEDFWKLWWDEPARTKKIMPFNREWSHEECLAMR